MNQLQTKKRCQRECRERIDPDVIVTHANQTALLKSQSRRASEWLSNHYRMSLKNVDDSTVIQAHPSRCKHIIEELKAAGFVVLTHATPARETPH